MFSLCDNSLHERSTANQPPLILKLLAHVVDLHLDIWMINGKISGDRENLGGLLEVVLACKPSWRLVAQEHADK